MYDFFDGRCTRSPKPELYQYLEKLYEGKIMKNEGAVTVLLLGLCLG